MYSKDQQRVVFFLIKVDLTNIFWVVFGNAGTDQWHFLSFQMGKITWEPNVLRVVTDLKAPLYLLLMSFLIHDLLKQQEEEKNTLSDSYSDIFVAWQNFHLLLDVPFPWQLDAELFPLSQRFMQGWRTPIHIQYFYSVFPSSRHFIKYNCLEHVLW